MSKGNKKGQEEIVGFILIIVMVLVVGMILLFMMKPRVTEEKDYQLDNLLYSVIGTSVDGKTVGTRIDECERGIDCNTLTGNLTEITDIAFSKSGYVVGKSIKGRNFTIGGGMTYSDSYGNVTSRSIASVTVVKNSLLKLKVYY